MPNTATPPTHQSPSAPADTPPLGHPPSTRLIVGEGQAAHHRRKTIATRLFGIGVFLGIAMWIASNTSLEPPALLVICTFPLFVVAFAGLSMWHELRVLNWCEADTRNSLIRFYQNGSYVDQVPTNEIKQIAVQSTQPRGSSAKSAPSRIEVYVEGTNGVRVLARYATEADAEALATLLRTQLPHLRTAWRASGV